MSVGNSRLLESAARLYDVEGKHIQRIVLGLIACERPFNLDPLPDERWRITIKEDDKNRCRDVIANRAEFFFENGQFKSEKQPAAEMLWAAISADDTAGASRIIRERGDGIARIGAGVMLQRAAAIESRALVRLLLDAGATPREWWDDDALDFIMAVRRNPSSNDSGQHGAMGAQRR